MKTAEQHLDAQLRGPERPQFVSYAEALAAVQAALDETGTVGQQVTTALGSFFGSPALLPGTTMRLPGPLPSPCFRCGQLACGCEQPPF